MSSEANVKDESIIATRQVTRSAGVVSIAVMGSRVLLEQNLVWMLSMRHFGFPICCVTYSAREYSAKRLSPLSQILM